VVTIIDIHQLNLGPFGSLNFWLKIHSKYVFFFSAIKAKYCMYLKKKLIPNEKERDFIVGHCIIFSDFFCLVMSYEPQT
jgi:thioredoxin-related protein